MDERLTNASSGSEDWARGRHILEQAVQLPEAERHAYLSRACGEDTVLRDALESILAVRPSAASEPSLAPGQKISHYQILSKIGEGGMGAVYKAVDSHLGRLVALKVISGAFISPEDKRRFGREAKAASALNHPNIVTIYEYNSENRLDFIVMEYVEGRTLQDIVRENVTPMPVLLAYACQLAGALSKAHAAGIVHRDLKPANVMITADGIAKVLDFGLAKHRQSAEDPDGATATLSITHAGCVMGTPAYMSPEQAMADTVDHATDIFAFGVILYEMVSGQRPFRGKDTLAILNQIIHKEPAPLPATVPPDVAALIHRCLRKAKEDRPASMNEAVRVLTEASASNPKVSSPAATSTLVAHPREPVAKRWQWRRSAAIATGASTFAAAAWIGAPQLQERFLSTRARTAPPVADPSNGSPSELTLRGRDLLRRYDKSGNLDLAVRVLNVAVEKDPEFAPAFALLAEAYLRKGVSVTSSDTHWLKLARDSANQAVALNPDLAAAHSILGSVLVEAGAAAEAKVEIERAIKLDPLSWEPYIPMARLNAKTDPAKAEELYRKAVALGPADWIPRSEYGRFLYRASRYREAAEQWEEATRIASDNVFMLRNLGAAYHMMDDFEKAASVLQRALALAPSAAVWNNLATARFFQGNYAESVAAFEKAVNLEPNNYVNWGNLGDAQRWAPGQRGKSMRSYERAIELVRDLIRRSPDDTELRGRLALYLAKSGQREESVAELTALATAPNLSAADRFKIALTYQVLEKRDLALRYLEEAIRGNYSLREIRNEPELASLRADVRYHQMIAQLGTSSDKQKR